MKKEKKDEDYMLVGDPTIDQLRAAMRGMDWDQIISNGGPPCFRIQRDGRFCGRALRWHGDDTHCFYPFEVVLKMAKDAMAFEITEAINKL